MIEARPYDRAAKALPRRLDCATCRSVLFDDFGGLCFFKARRLLEQDLLRDVALR